MFAQKIVELIAIAEDLNAADGLLTQKTEDLLFDIAVKGMLVNDFADELKESGHWPKKDDGTPQGEKAARGTAAGTLLNRVKALAAKFETDEAGVLVIDNDALKRKEKESGAAAGKVAGEGKDDEAGDETGATVEVEAVLQGIKVETLRAAAAVIRSEFDEAMTAANATQKKMLHSLLLKINAKLEDLIDL